MSTKVVSTRFGVPQAWFAILDGPEWRISPERKTRQVVDGVHVKLSGDEVMFFVAVIHYVGTEEVDIHMKNLAYEPGAWVDDETLPDGLRAVLSGCYEAWRKFADSLMGGKPNA